MASPFRRFAQRGCCVPSDMVAIKRSARKVSSTFCAPQRLHPRGILLTTQSVIERPDVQAALAEYDEKMKTFSARELLSSTEFFDAYLDLRSVVAHFAALSPLLVEMDAKAGQLAGQTLISKDQAYNTFLDIRQAVAALAAQN